MRVSLYVEVWRAGERIARDVPIVDWAWSEKWPAIPAGRLTVTCPADWWPAMPLDPLRPMGQTIHAEVQHDGHATPLPPCRIMEASEAGGGVAVTADSWDVAISEDPWPVPSSPPRNATLLGEAARLADPLRVALAAPDVILPQGITWPTDRDDALLELGEGYGLRWELRSDGSLLGIPLGSIQEPDRTYREARVVKAPRKAKRARVTRASVVLKGQQDQPDRMVTERLFDDAYRPEVYGTIGKVEQAQNGATPQAMRARARAMLAAGAGEREFDVTADPTLRAGMVARVLVDRPEGREQIIGRVVGHTLRHDGQHSVIVREA